MAIQRKRIHSIPPPATVAASICGPIAQRIDLAKSKWTGFEKSLRECYVQVGQGDRFALDPFAVLRFLASLRSSPTVYADIGEEAVRAVDNWAKAESNAALAGFDGELKRFCEVEAIGLAGRFPQYVLDGFLSVKVSPEEGACVLGATKVPSLFAGRVCLQIMALVREERARGFDATVFIETLQRAYLRATALAGAKVGSPISARTIFRELVVVLQPAKFWSSPVLGHFVEYSDAHFRRDLGRLIQSGHLSTENACQMEVTPTAFAKDGIPVVIDGATRYIGHMAFRGRTP